MGVNFVPSYRAMSQKNEPGLWFIFWRQKLLASVERGNASIPYCKSPGELGLKPVRTCFVGDLDGTACYGAECAGQVSIPEGMIFHGLRRLFGSLADSHFWIAGRAREILDWERTHQYCNQCGAPLREKTDERAKVCPGCGLVNYPRISPAIIVAVIRGNEILLARALRFPNGFYSVLAGFVEPGESLEESVKREVREEVGIEIKNIRYFGSQPWPFPNSLMIGFTAEYAEGEISVDKNEIVDAGWFTAKTLPEKIPGKISIARRLIDWFTDSNANAGANPDH